MLELFRSRCRPNCRRRVEALGLLLGFYRGLFVCLERLLEVFDAFAQALSHFRNLLAAEQQHGHSKHYQELRSGKATKTSSLKALRKHLRPPFINYSRTLARQ